jgi:hypothetical protein
MFFIPGRKGVVAGLESVQGEVLVQTQGQKGPDQDGEGQQEGEAFHEGRR